MSEPPRVPSSPAQRAPLDIRFKHAMLLIDGASVVGFGFLIEKCFENGRATLPTTNAAGERIEFESLAQLAAVTDGEISFVNPLPTDDFKL